uniref:Large ribosomal subunit protein uL6 n=1 Tax=Chlamydiales bacterium PN TaxID=1910939 RepID=A0A1K0JNL8_9CHLA|nr:50S ribosomal protein L6 [Chlamydiales bacterium PN]
MSRKGKMPVVIPQGVEVKVQNDTIVVKGPKATLEQQLVAGVAIEVGKGEATVTVTGTSKQAGAFHGLYRALLQNMVIGTTQGFEKRLEMIGVGYRAAVQGNVVDLQVGYSHPTQLEIPQGLQVKVEKNTLIIITGADKQAVGEFAATIRAKRPPEPYQGKGIRYAGEYVRRKAGKTSKSGKK